MKFSSTEHDSKTRRSLEELSPRATEAQAQPFSEAMLGHVVENIRIESVLGSGRTAFVYKGTDLVLQRPVALKVLRGASAPAAFDELIAEARQLAKLTHPNLLKVYHVMRHEGRSCLVLEFADAGPLSTRTNVDHKPAWQDVLRWGAAAARGLASAHAKGIVHCDVKPSNLLLFGDGRCVVADFGLSRHAHPDEVTLGFIGTPLYASPEVIRRAPPSPASDQYSLAATVWHLLTGSPPFYAPTDRAILSLHVSGRLPSLSSLAPELPAAANAAIKKSLAKSPSDRFESIELLAQHFDEARRSIRRTIATPTSPDRATSTTLPVMREVPSGPPSAANAAGEVWLAPGRSHGLRSARLRRRALIGGSIASVVVLATAGAYIGASHGTSRDGAQHSPPPQSHHDAPGSPEVAAPFKPVLNSSDSAALMKLAHEHPGAEVIVRGTIWSTDESSTGKSLRLLFGPRDDAGTFHVLCYSDVFPKLRQLGKGSFGGLVGQKIEVEGNLREYKGVARVILRDGDSVRLAP